MGVDPTNRARAGERYVKIGHGRHYDDVPPTKGVYRGGPADLGERRDDAPGPGDERARAPIAPGCRGAHHRRLAGAGGGETPCGTLRR